MNFSESMKHTNSIAEFSPDGIYLASVVQQRLIIKDSRSLEVVQIFKCQDVPQEIKWSPDSTLIACAIYRRSLVQIWWLQQPTWYCKIDEGSAGLINIMWSPNSRHILTTAEFHVRMTVWSLVNTSFSYIRYPKNVELNCAFSPNNKYFALLERRDCKDRICIFDYELWQMLQNFETDTKDAAGFMWSPDSKFICVWESLLDYKIMLYMLDGAKLWEYSPSVEEPLGIKSIAWSLSGQFLSIGSYDEKMRVLNPIIWKPLVEFNHSELTIKDTTVVYQETEKIIKATSSLDVCKINKYEVINERPVNITSTRTDVIKANPKIGVGCCSFSTDNRYIVTLNENNPSAVWIWSMEEIQLAALLLQMHPVKHVQWDPIKNRLAICTGGSKIYMWTPTESVVVELPQQVSFEIQSFRWHSHGDMLLLFGKDQMCACYL